jgi:uncharacterized membrane protein YhaH (DUF805 family)
MSFGEAVSSGFSNYASFESRAMRSEYWFWFLFAVIASFVALIADALVGSAPLLYLLTVLALFLPGLAVGVRRLHDIDKSGWNLLWGLIPIFGSLYLLYLNVQPGTTGENRYGRER